MIELSELFKEEKDYARFLNIDDFSRNDSNTTKVSDLNDADLRRYYETAKYLEKSSQDRRNIYFEFHGIREYEAAEMKRIKGKLLVEYAKRIIKSKDMENFISVCNEGSFILETQHVSRSHEKVSLPVNFVLGNTFEEVEKNIEELVKEYQKRR